jgi:hypothetical protein
VLRGRSEEDQQVAPVELFWVTTTRVTNWLDPNALPVRLLPVHVDRHRQGRPPPPILQRLADRAVRTVQRERR